MRRAKVIFGSAWDYLDEIALGYPNYYWWFSEKGLCMEVLPPEPPDFYQLAGSLVSEARIRLGTHRLPEQEYRNIAVQLSKFPLLECLPAKSRQVLADWNQKHPIRAIKTFEAALESKQPRGIRREVLRCLYRAAQKFKTHP